MIKQTDGFNYQVFRAGNQNPSKDKNLLFQIRKATLSSLLFTYSDPKQSQEYTFHIQSGMLSGQVNAHLLSFETDLVLKI